MTGDYNDYTLSKRERAAFVLILALSLCIAGYAFYESLIPAAAGMIGCQEGGTSFPELTKPHAEKMLCSFSFAISSTAFPHLLRRDAI